MENNVSMRNYIGIDIGGTSIKYGIIDEKGHILHSFSDDANIDMYSIPLIERVKSIAKKIQKFAISNNIKIEGVGVSATGQVDKNTGTIIGTCGNIPGWIGTPVKASLREIFNKPIVVENDGNCAAIAEHWIGNGRKFDNLVMYTIGTGIGAGIIINDKLYSGHNGIAGEIGHMIIDSDEKKCTCGNYGCFEQYGSMIALIRKVNENNDLINIEDGKKLFELYKKGDRKIKRHVDEFIHFNAVGITNLVHIFNPEAIIIGGGVSNQKEVIIEPIKKKVLQMVMPAFSKDLVITTAKLGNKAGMIGAVKYLIDSIS